MTETTQDTLLGGRVRLLQSAAGHRAGSDAVLLAAAAASLPGDLIADVGAGTGAVGLMISALRANPRLTFVEREAPLAALCRQNAVLNGIAASVVEADLLDKRSWPPAGLLAQSADIVATNPPFLEKGRARISPDAGRAAAHVIAKGGLEAWIAACASLLKPKGHLALIHRADRLADCLKSLKGFGGVALRFVHPQADRPAIRLILTAQKGSRAPLAVKSALVLHDKSGAFTPHAQAIHRGEAVLT